MRKKDRLDPGKMERKKIGHKNAKTQLVLRLKTEALHMGEKKQEGRHSGGGKRCFRKKKKSWAEQKSSWERNYPSCSKKTGASMEIGRRFG